MLAPCGRHFKKKVRLQLDDQSTQHVVMERIFELSLAAREVLSRTLMKERIGSLVSFETSPVARRAAN